MILVLFENIWVDFTASCCWIRRPLSSLSVQKQLQYSNNRTWHTAAPSDTAPFTFFQEAFKRAALTSSLTLQRRGWRGAVRRSDDRVHQQQAERPEAQRDPLPSPPPRADPRSDGEVPKRPGTAEARWTRERASFSDTFPNSQTCLICISKCALGLIPKIFFQSTHTATKIRI